MLLIDSVTKSRWSGENANLKLGEIRAKAQADLIARSLSRGVPEGTRTVVAGEDNRWVVDYDASRNRHTGRDVRLLTTGRWAEFCSEPRDEKAETAHLVAEKHEKVVGAKIKAAAGIEESLKEKPSTFAAPIASTVLTETPSVDPALVKRGRGRPRKE